MIKHDILMATTAILSCAFLAESARAECPEDYTIVDGRCIKTDTACDGSCTWVYDYDARSLTYQGTGTIKYSVRTYGIGPIKDLTIGEGITGISQNTPSTDTFPNIGAADGKLILPSTLRSVGGYTMTGLRFGTVEINSDNVSFAHDALHFANGVEANIIIKPGSNVRAGVNTFYGYGYGAGATLHFMCKSSNAADCGSGMTNAINSFTNAGGSASVGLYEGNDGNGNWEVWSDDGVAIYDDSTKQKLLSKYDMDGNQTGIYKYDGAGNLTAAYENGVSTYKRTSYTPAEAAAAVKKGNKNKVTLIFK